MFNIVLLNPEIPSNTGNIGRTCIITGASLHLIRPLGFMINDKTLKRAGLDYWDRLGAMEHLDLEHFYSYYEKSVSENKPKIYYATTKARKRYTDVHFNPGDYIMFGPESAGIPEEVLVEHPDECIRIPMLPEERSLNLSNSVAIIIYEALRQNDFKGLESEGDLHRLKW